MCVEYQQKKVDVIKNGSKDEKENEEEAKCF